MDKSYVVRARLYNKSYALRLRSLLLTTTLQSIKMRNLYTYNL
jgi:hypothetical protein